MPSIALNNHIFEFKIIPLQFSFNDVKYMQEAVKKKNQYLHEAKADRQQLEASMHQVGDWLQGAEELLDSGYHGLDYSSIDQTLTEFSVST